MSKPAPSQPAAAKPAKEDPEAKWKCARWVEEEDHSKETAELLGRINADTIAPLLRSTARTFDDYIGEILALEKKARFGGDVLSTQKLSVEVVKIYRTLHKFDDMFTAMEELMKKRGQMKQVQSAMIHEASNVLLGAVGESLSIDQRSTFLQKFKFLSEGKIHVDLEHARFSLELAAIYEQQGRVKEASDMLLAVQVETVTTMPRVEKIQNIIKQLQLALDLNDLDRAAQLSRKFNPRAIGKDDTKAWKIEYFWLMSEYYERQTAATNAAYLALAKCWYEIYQTMPQGVDGVGVDHTVPENSVIKTAAATSFVKSKPYPKLATEALSNSVLALIIAPHTSQKEVDDACECTAFQKETLKKDRTSWIKDLLDNNKLLSTELPTLERLLIAFRSSELIRASCLHYVDQLNATHPLLIGHPARRDALICRLSEHDVFTAAGYYRSIRLGRLASLVGLTVERTEQFILSLVSTKTIFAKIDRVDDIVVFEKSQNPVAVAEAWNAGVEKVTGLLDRVAHLIAKERMVAASAAAASSTVQVAAAA